MENQNNQPRIKISLGGFVVLIILALILFKVDIKDKVESPQFKKNLSYVTNQIKDLWLEYVIKPIKSKTGEVMVDMVKKGFEEAQKNMGSSSLNIEDIEKKINYDDLNKEM